MPTKYSIVVFVSNRNERDVIVELIKQKYGQYIKYIGLDEVSFLNGKNITFRHERANRHNPNHYWEYTAEDYMEFVYSDGGGN